MATILDTRQSENRAQLPALGTDSNEQLNSILDNVNIELNVPLRMYATFPTPNAILNIRGSAADSADAAENSIPPIQGVVVDFPDSTINFQAGTTTGGTFVPNSGAGTVTLPASTVGQYRRVGFSLLSSGSVQLVFSAESVTLGGLANPGTLFVDDSIPMGWLDLQATASTAFKTANSATNIIENAPGGVAAIHRFTKNGFTSSNTLNSYPNYFVSPLGNGDFLDFTSAIAALPVSGGVLCLMDDITVNAATVIPANVLILGRNKNAIITFGASGSFSVTGTQVALQDLNFFTAQASITLINVSGELFKMSGCSFDCSSSLSTNKYVYMGANGTDHENCLFKKTLTPSTNTAVEYPIGFTENTYRAPIFTT